MATIPGVSDDELIRTSWGDAVANELNGNVVKLTGTQTVGGAKTFSGTTEVTGPALLLPVTQSVHAQAAVHRTWVDDTFARTTELDTAVDARVAIAGDVMTGLLQLPNLRFRDASPTIEFYNAAVTDLYGFIAVTSTEMHISGGTTMRFTAGGAERMRISTSTLLIGKTAADTDVAGLEVPSTGTNNGQIRSTVASNATQNIQAKHVGTADASNVHFLTLLHSASNTRCGEIRQGPGDNAIFDAGVGGSHATSSDYRLKDDLGPIDDPVGKLMQLQPKHLRWKPESGATGEFDGFIAHEVTPVAPWAVLGAKDAVLPADHPTDPGGIDSQGLDEKKLNALLTAALQDAHVKIADLTARLEALEAV